MSSEALRLAHELILAMRDTDVEHWDTLEEAAAELRRLHAENEALREANEAFGKRQEWWNEKMVALEAINAELREALRWYVDTDETEYMEGNEYWLDGRERARAALAKAGEE